MLHIQDLSFLENISDLNCEGISGGATLKGRKLNGFVRNGNELNAFTITSATVNGTELQSIKLVDGQLIAVNP